MCVRVKVLNPAYPTTLWEACREPGEMAGERARLACVVDLTADGQHATLAVAAVLDDGRVRVETVAEWAGPRAASAMEQDLPGWIEKIKPKAVGWLPDGPAAAVASRLTDRRKAGVRGWAPRGVTVTEIRGDRPAICMGLNKEIVANTLVHSGQEMLDAQIDGAEKSWQGDVWVVTRRGGGNTDAVYAVAGAVHLARTMPRRREVSRRGHAGG
jgi:hypothetical protein